jgi:ribonuclease P protein component
MDIIYSKNKKNYHRLAVIVSRKNGTATVRNRKKRQVREFFRQINEQVPHHYDLLIKIHPESGPLTSYALEGSFKKWHESLKESFHGA